MSVRRRGKKGTYQFDFQHRGLRLRGSTGTTERAAALRIEGRRRIEVAEGRHRRPEMSLNEAAERYFQEIARHQPSAATTDYQLENLVKDLGPGTRLSEIDDAGALATYIARRRARVSDSSVNREIQLLRRVMRRAERVWKVAVDMPVWTDHMLVEPAGRIRELTADEEAALFQSLRPDFHPLVMFCLITGARRSEALTLTWRQVDMGAGVIVLRAKSRRPGGEPHVIPMTGELRALLQGETGHNPVRVFTYVCKRSRGKRRAGERYPFSATGWTKAWRAAKAAAGIEDFRFHDLRHTTATRLLRSSGNLKIVQRLLGHASIETTARYAHAQLDDLREALEKSVTKVATPVSQDSEKA